MSNPDSSTALRGQDTHHASSSQMSMNLSQDLSDPESYSFATFSNSFPSLVRPNPSFVFSNSNLPRVPRDHPQYRLHTVAHLRNIFSYIEAKILEEKLSETWKIELSFSTPCEPISQSLPKTNYSDFPNPPPSSPSQGSEIKSSTLTDLKRAAFSSVGGGDEEFSREIPNPLLSPYSRSQTAETPQKDQILSSPCNRSYRVLESPVSKANILDSTRLFSAHPEKSLESFELDRSLAYNRSPHLKTRQEFIQDQSIPNVNNPFSKVSLLDAVDLRVKETEEKLKNRELQALHNKLFQHSKNTSHMLTASLKTLPERPDSNHLLGQPESEVDLIKKRISELSSQKNTLEGSPAKKTGYPRSISTLVSPPSLGKKSSRKLPKSLSNTAPVGPSKRTSSFNPSPKRRSAKYPPSNSKTPEGLVRSHSSFETIESIPLTSPDPQPPNPSFSPY